LRKQKEKEDQQHEHDSSSSNSNKDTFFPPPSFRKVALRRARDPPIVPFAEGKERGTIPEKSHVVLNQGGVERSSREKNSSRSLRSKK